MTSPAPPPDIEAAVAPTGPRVRQDRTDAVLGAAVDLAHAAAKEVGGADVGEHLGSITDAERVVTHLFAATLTGYTGWNWAVTLTRASRSRVVTVDEVVLLPGSTALLPPPWVPWSQRLQAGDLGPGDILPAADEDDRLVPAYAGSSSGSVTDAEAPGETRQVALELGLGRVRVLSRDGRLDAADRWFVGAGPDTEMARQAPGHCGTCGFLVSVAGALQAGFGVCANEYSPADGRVVSVEYGCGAHSEATVTAVESVPESAVFETDAVLIEAN